MRHASDCLIAQGADSPSIAVARQLRAAIGGDEGTVLHWFSHERTILRSVRDAIQANPPTDAAALLEFLGRLGIEKDSNLRMVDLGALVKDQVFLSGTGGSSSMKKFLRPVMAQSPYLHGRYAQPVYGTPDMPSLNFPAGWVWWREEGGAVRDPYTLLGQLLTDPVLDATTRAAEDDEATDFVANGGAAMLAYAELQQPDLPIEERQRIEGQLKRYCELDTLAMVMVYEALREWVRCTWSAFGRVESGLLFESLFIEAASRIRSSDCAAARTVSAIDFAQPGRAAEFRSLCRGRGSSGRGPGSRAAPP